jgi:putative transposase
VSEVYPVVAQLAKEGFDVNHVCKWLGVSRSGYYQFQSDDACDRKQEDERLKPLIKEAFFAHRRRYGARRISLELKARGETCGREKTRKIMDEMGLVAIQPRSFKPRTTDSRHKLGYDENLLMDAAPPTRINEVWVGDITYIPLTKDWAYLAMLMDLYSRRIVGWVIDDHMREPLVSRALRQAMAARQPQAGLIHHTDRGGQYAATGYRAVLQRAKIEQSMSRADNCYDNAFMESCFGTIKTELELKPYPSLEEASREIQEYVNYYNTLRRHSGIEYHSPLEFERRHRSRPR